jgi:hypothetical protein
VLKYDYIPYILAFHLQIDAAPVANPAYHLDFLFDADPDY